MVKIIIGFVLFAAVALWILNKSGGNIDLGGEKHDVAPAADHAPASAPVAASAPASAASQ